MKISGTEDEVLETQAMHAVAVDDLDDSPALREFIRVSLKAEMVA